MLLVSRAAVSSPTYRVSCSTFSGWLKWNRTRKGNPKKQSRKEGREFVGCGTESSRRVSKEMNKRAELEWLLGCRASCNDFGGWVEGGGFDSPKKSSLRGMTDMCMIVTRQKGGAEGEQANKCGHRYWAPQVKERKQNVERLSLGALEIQNVNNHSGE